MNELHLFAGAGGGILGSILLGHKIVCAVECDPWCQAVLLQRQKDGILPSFPIWDDVRTFDGRPWRGIVDCISGGFPCQDISTAGKGEGITGPSSGLWKEFARVIDEMGPRYVFLENSPALTSRGLGVVLGDLASMGFDAEWCVLGASDVGAPHIRKRIWILAYSMREGFQDWEPRGFQESDGSFTKTQQATERQGCSWWSPEPPWVEWLMGWVIEWTDLEPLGMDRFQRWLFLHGIR